ncbi:hypothetical protein CC80DRAFT_509578 [Byssothecium circinans]|uniref:Uncharacterized protein n=1 Tax=Byssothecium circinans TaxID=147558 RepID=A0A6A5TG63_9PLEO|nr:hypothetical protein CC80DRAFT_509578 [Byssothecium circinans]
MKLIEHMTAFLKGVLELLRNKPENIIQPANLTFYDIPKEEVRDLISKWKRTRKEDKNKVVHLRFLERIGEGGSTAYITYFVVWKIDPALPPRKQNAKPSKKVSPAPRAKSIEASNERALNTAAIRFARRVNEAWAECIETSSEDEESMEVASEELGPGIVERGTVYMEKGFSNHGNCVEQLVSNALNVWELKLNWEKFCR